VVGEEDRIGEGGGVSGPGWLGDVGGTLPLMGSGGGGSRKEQDGSLSSGGLVEAIGAAANCTGKCVIFRGYLGRARLLAAARHILETRDSRPRATPTTKEQPRRTSRRAKIRVGDLHPDVAPLRSSSRRGGEQQPPAAAPPPTGAAERSYAPPLHRVNGPLRTRRGVTPLPRRPPAILEPKRAHPGFLGTGTCSGRVRDVFGTCSGRGRRAEGLRYKLATQPRGSRPFGCPRVPGIFGESLGMPRANMTIPSRSSARTRD
jgi:hypothetical protein